MHFDFPGNGNFRDLMYFAYWWKSIRKGLLPKRLQHLIFVLAPLYPRCFMSFPLCNKAILLPTIGHFHRLYHMSPTPTPTLDNRDEPPPTEANCPFSPPVNIALAIPPSGVYSLHNKQIVYSVYKCAPNIERVECAAKIYNVHCT